MSRIKRKNKKTSCYMCDASFTSKEHVPPLAFFPEASELEKGVSYRKNLITVPSCDQHNGSTSEDDQYLLFVITSSFGVGSIAQNIFSEKIIRSILRRPSLIHFFKNKFVTSIGGKQRMGFEVDRIRFDRSISKIASALYYFAYKDKWSGDFFVYSPDLFSIKSNAYEVNKTIYDLEVLTGTVLSSIEFSGENPQIFRYKLFRRDNWYFARLLFYQGLVVNAFSENNQLSKNA